MFNTILNPNIIENIHINWITNNNPFPIFPAYRGLDKISSCIPTVVVPTRKAINKKQGIKINIVAIIPKVI